MRFAYADRPYPGMAHLYKDHPDYAGEVDHAALIARLVAEFPDGWALSTSSKTLVSVLRFCPDSVRVAAWCTTDAQRPPGNAFTSAWQPLILHRTRPAIGQCLDFMVSPRIPEGAQSGFAGVKPMAYCFWLFRCLGALPGDDFVDLFPGSGAVGRAWDKFQRQMTLPTLGEREKQTRIELAV